MRVLSLSLSLFPLKRLSRFEEVLGVFISCAYLFCLCGKKKLFKVVVVFLSVVSRKEAGKMHQNVLKKGGRQTKEKFSTLSLFIFRYKRTLLAITTRYKKEYRVLFTATRGTEREREREMRKSSRGGVTTVLAKKKISSSFSQKRYHHRTPLGEINDDDEEDEQRVREKDSPMTVRRKWNKEHGVVCGGGNSPSSARFKATAMDKVLILNRRVDTLEVRTILRLKCLPLLLELVTVFNLSFARDDVNVMSALN